MHPLSDTWRLQMGLLDFLKAFTIQAENGWLEVKGQKWEKLVDYSLKCSNYFLHSHQLFRFCFLSHLTWCSILIINDVRSVFWGWGTSSFNFGTILKHTPGFLLTCMSPGNPPQCWFIIIRGHICRWSFNRGWAGFYYLWASGFPALAIFPN